jgi:hypothetical protein
MEEVGFGLPVMAWREGRKSVLADSNGWEWRKSVLYWHATKPTLPKFHSKILNVVKAAAITIYFIYCSKMPPKEAYFRLTT